MESPLALFLKWLESEKTNPTSNDICFQFLALCPNYGLEKLEIGQNYYEQVRDILTKIEDKKLIVGMSLAVDNIVSFVVNDWDDINKTLDSMSTFDPNGAKSEGERRLLENARENQARSIAPRKEIKQSWTNFQNSTFNFDYFDRYLIQEDFLGTD